MADNNQNWRNQSQQSKEDWDQHRNRYTQEHENRSNENYGSYGNAGYSSQRRDNYGNEGYGSNNNEYDNRVRYSNQQNDWRDNRYGQSNREQDYDTTSGWNNPTGAFNRNQGNIGNSGQYGSQNWRRNEYGSQYRSEGQGYGGGYGQSGYQDRYGASGGQYGNRGYGNREQNYNTGRQEHERDWWDKTRDEVSSWFGDDDAERRRRMDRMTSGQYKGKGPKDYKRSEDRIREDVCDRLTDDDMLDATNIQIQIQGDEVILTGSVDSREQKRRAEDLVESVSGVKNVENRLRVEHSYQGATQSTLSSSSEKVRLSKDR